MQKKKLSPKRKARSKPKADYAFALLSIALLDPKIHSKEWCFDRAQQIALEALEGGSWSFVRESIQPEVI
jgi:hypothetical protein